MRRGSAMSDDADGILLDYLRPRDWRRLLAAAEELGIGRGGYVDRRADLITLWCGPEEKPAGWPADVPIAAGASGPPRAYVAQARLGQDDEIDWTNARRQPVVLRIACYVVYRARSRGGPAGGSADDDGARVAGDEAWCRRQWRRLKEYAEVVGFPA
jgi:hypothetical protein